MNQSEGLNYSLVKYTLKCVQKRQQRAYLGENKALF